MIHEGTPLQNIRAGRDEVTDEGKKLTEKK